MVRRFNPPPNWPAPPEGWVPDPSWRPDPAWGPAPEGWNFWLDDEDERHLQAAESGNAASSDETVFSASRAAEVFSSYSAYFNEQPPDGLSDAGHGQSWNAGSPGGYPVGDVPGPIGANPRPVGETGTLGPAIDGTAPSAPSAAMPQYQARPQYQAMPASAALPPVLGGQPFADAGSGQSDQRPKKKGFFTRPIGVILILLIVIGLIVGGFFAVKSLLDDKNDESLGMNITHEMKYVEYYID